MTNHLMDDAAIGAALSGKSARTGRRFREREWDGPVFTIAGRKYISDRAAVRTRKAAGAASGPDGDCSGGTGECGGAGRIECRRADRVDGGRCRANGPVVLADQAARRARLEDVEKVSQLPQQHGHDGPERQHASPTVPHRRIAGRAGYRSWFLFVLVVVAAI